MADIEVSNAGIMSVITDPGDILLTTFSVMTVFNVPAEEVDVTEAGIISVIKQEVPVNVSQLAIMAVIRGRIENPKLKAWGFTLDGHDFYVLRLGYAGKTLVYDVSTKQWSWWQDASSSNSWKVQTGIRFEADKTSFEQNLSNVVVGDDTIGVLYRLDPSSGVDASSANPSTLTSRFERIATGQITTSERRFVPIYRVTLTGSPGQPVADGDEIEHLYSDDLGNNYVTAGSVAVSTGSFNQDFMWRSLGLAIPAGRLFRIRDYGAMARIDGLDVQHGGE